MRRASKPDYNIYYTPSDEPEEGKTGPKTGEERPAVQARPVGSAPASASGRNPSQNISGHAGTKKRGRRSPYRPQKGPVFRLPEIRLPRIAWPRFKRPSMRLPSPKLPVLKLPPLKNLPPARNIVSIACIAAALAVLLAVRPWKWFSGQVMASAVTADTVAQPVPLNHLLSNSDSALPEAGKFDRAVEQFMTRWDITGASLAIMKDGDLIYSKGYGWADKEDSVRMEVRHILRLASLSKLITATAVMKLYEQGKLTLDSRVFGPQGILNDSLFLRYTDKRIPDVTIEQLLRHKGGFTVRAGDPMFDWQLVQRVLKRQPPYTIDDYVEYAVRSGLGFRPGTRTYYSNLGYVVLSKVIEKLTGQPYETYVQDSILAPAGCYDMHIGHSRHAEKFPNEVRYYETKEAEKFPACDGSGQMTAKSDGGNDIQGLSGAGGWVASPTEILLFVAAIDGSDTRPDILQPATIRLMTQKTDGSLPLGWMSTEKDGTWSRTGTMSGTNALLRKQSNGYTWVFVTNTSSWKGSRFHRYISTMLRNAFGKVSEWPERDLFIADSLQNDASAGDTTDLSQTTSIP